MNTSPLVQDLLEPDGEMVETHISWVLLKGGDVWKLKKPVSMGFLDFSTPQLRRVACEAEVRLNRQRLLRRDKERGVSDGRLEIFDDFLACWQTVDELSVTEHVGVDTAQPLTANLETLRDRLGGWPD